jgi:predicted transcriptional regulator
MLERLHRKQRLERRRTDDGLFRYVSPVAASELLRGVVHSFIEGPLAGSISPFVAYLAEASDISSEELAELESMVEQLQDRRRRQ